MNINKEKLKSINYWLRHYQLFKCDEAWLVNHIREITDETSWKCMDQHTESGLLHERQLAYLINETNHIPKLYKDIK